WSPLLMPRNLPICFGRRQCRTRMKPIRLRYCRHPRNALASAETKHGERKGDVVELHEMRYFLALSKTLNFTRDAEICHVSQPALTRAIQKMEDELGGLLFSRERNNTHLTELGRLLEPHLVEVLARTEQAKETATRFLRLEKANLALGVMCTIAPLQFVSFLGRFRADNPGIEVALLESVPDALCDLLLKGELDLALMARPDGFPAPLRAAKL